MLDTYGRKYVQPIIKFVAKGFIAMKFSANQVTYLAFVLGVVTAILAYYHLNILAVLLLWISGLLDAVDGTIAREKGSTPFGTVLDITFDRLVEIAMIVALALRDPSNTFILLILSGSIIFSMTVFLSTGIMSNKNSEKSFYYQAGVAERTEGFIFFSLMILLGRYTGVIGVIFTLLIIFTALQRLNEGRKILGG